MRGGKLRAGLDKLSAPKNGDSADSPPSHAALASTLEIADGTNRLAEAREIEIDRVRPNPGQPRKAFPAESLEDLAASIREQGVLQPITVVPDGDGYRIVAGERRWRAAQVAGLARIPAMVRQLSDRDQRIVSLMENLQREDLNDIDRARGLADLRDALEAASPDLRSHELDEEVGKRLGVSGRSVRNFLGLLALAETARDAIASGPLTEKHGRAIRRLEEPEVQAKMAKAAVKHGLTGEETTVVVSVLQQDSRLDVNHLSKLAKSGKLMNILEAAARGEDVSLPLPPPKPDPVEEALKRLEADIRRLESLVPAMIEPPTNATLRRFEKAAKNLVRIALRAAGDEVE